MIFDGRSTVARVHRVALRPSRLFEGEVPLSRSPVGLMLVLIGRFDGP